MQNTRALSFATVLCLLIASTDAAGEQKKNNATVAAELDSQLATLEGLETHTPCQKAVLTALKDVKVRKLFLEKAANACYTLKKVCCLDIPHIPEHEYVLFDFDCMPGCFCIVDPQFLVVVNKTEDKVIAINNPYSGPTTPCNSILCA